MSRWSHTHVILFSKGSMRFLADKEYIMISLVTNSRALTMWIVCSGSNVQSWWALLYIMNMSILNNIKTKPSPYYILAWYFTTLKNVWRGRGFAEKLQVAHINTQTIYMYKNMPYNFTSFFRSLQIFFPDADHAFMHNTPNDAYIQSSRKKATLDCLDSC